MLQHCATTWLKLGRLEFPIWPCLWPETASKHGHEHIRLHAGKIYPDPDLVYVDTPMFLKRDARRSVEQVPVLLPSTALTEFVTAEVSRSTELSDATLRGLECYKSHPVVQRASRETPGTLVRPLALNWDGVQYSINDNFMGFYITDILSGQKFLSFLLRQFLSWSPTLLVWKLGFGYSGKTKYQARRKGPGFVPSSVNSNIVNPPHSFTRRR